MFRHCSLTQFSNLWKLHHTLEERLHGFLIYSIQNHTSSTTPGCNIIAETNCWKTFKVWGAQFQLLCSTKIKPPSRTIVPLWICKCILDREFHIWWSKLGNDRTINKFNKEWSDCGWTTTPNWLLEIEEPAGLNQFQCLVHLVAESWLFSDPLTRLGALALALALPQISVLWYECGKAHRWQ